MSEVADRVKSIVVDKLGVQPDQVTETASFITDLGADSLDTVELIMDFEKEFGVTIPDEEAEKIKTVGDAIAFVAAIFHRHLINRREISQKRNETAVKF